MSNHKNSTLAAAYGTDANIVIVAPGVWQSPDGILTISR